LTADRTLRITPGETVTVRRSDEDLLEVEGEWAPSGSPPPKHYPSQSEHFEVLEGTLRTSVDGVERDLHAGEALDIPPRAVQRMWNPGAEPARALWQTRPRGRTEPWFTDIDALYARAAWTRTGCLDRSPTECC
jgi:mannose-6-phosphate isomerase-like protein (cupin superfamily)